MYFKICDSYSIKNNELLGEKSILIRVLEPSYLKNGIPYEIENINEYSNVLELYINDDKNSFKAEDANKLNNFIINNDFDEIVVHCSLGMSRSPAIMICIAKILNSKELEQLVLENYKFYNKYIVSTFEKNSYCIKELVDKNINLVFPTLYKTKVKKY